MSSARFIFRGSATRPRWRYGQASSPLRLFTKMAFDTGDADCARWASSGLRRSPLRSLFNTRQRWSLGSEVSFRQSKGLAPRKRSGANPVRSVGRAVRCCSIPCELFAFSFIQAHALDRRLIWPAVSEGQRPIDPPQRPTKRLRRGVDGAVSSSIDSRHVNREGTVYEHASMPSTRQHG